MKVRNIIFILIPLIIFLSCGEEKKYKLNPETYLIKQLSEKEIIMFGDFTHGNALPYKSLIFLLDEWLNQIKTGESTDYNLTLVLEGDDEIIDIIKNYISQGNLKPAVEFFAPFGTLEILEFYSDLRSFAQKVDSINNTNKISEYVKFNIIGGEPFNLSNNTEILAASEVESSRFFVNTRDSLIANKIEAYTGENDKTKLIVFYGNAHLQDNYISKGQFAKGLDKNEAYGFYLAYYLKNIYGVDKVLTVDQMVVNHRLLIDTPFANVEENAFFTLSKNIPWKYRSPENYDAYIIRKDVMTPSHPLAIIFSKNIIIQSIQKMSFLKPYLNGYHAQFYYNRAEESFKFLTGAHNLDWNKWNINTDYDGLSLINNIEFAAKVFHLYCENPTNYKIKRKLNELGIGSWVMKQNLISKEDWKDRWPSELEKIKFINAIGIYWVGTDSEKLDAKSFLVSHTGKDYNNPKNYLKLFRESVYKVTY
jgi:hypothetical protein